MTASPGTVAYIREQIPDWDGNANCFSCAGVIVDYDPHKRVRERVEELTHRRYRPGVMLRCSPDIAHMLLGPDLWHAPEHGVSLRCDPSLPPNSIVAES